MKVETEDLALVDRRIRKGDHVKVEIESRAFRKLDLTRLFDTEDLHIRDCSQLHITTMHL